MLEEPLYFTIRRSGSDAPSILLQSIHLRFIGLAEVFRGIRFSATRIAAAVWQKSTVNVKKLLSAVCTNLA
jgi:hypothetical protein